MKVMVTGGAGFIGSHVVDGLLAKGHQVVVIDNLSSGKIENLSEHLSLVSGRQKNTNPNLKFYQIDIRDPALGEIFKSEEPDLVNHHAAQIDVRKSVADPIYDAQVNIIGSLNILNCCLKSGVKKIVFASSGGAIYGEPKYLPADESHPINPTSPYGLSKFTFEAYLLIHHQLLDLSYISLRYGNVYGPRQDPYGEAGVVAIFIRKMLEGKPPTINGSGEQIRDFVYVEDVVAANLLAMNVLARGTKEGLVVNIGTGKGASVNQLFDILKESFKFNQEPIYGPPKIGEQERIYLEISKAQGELGWFPKIGFLEGLEKTIAYFRSRFTVESSQI